MVHHTDSDILRADFEKAQTTLEKQQKTIGPFLVRTANQCLEEAKVNPIPKRLFSDFWFEYEFCVLFADTNVGKSILAVQIADLVSKGKSMEGFPVDCDPQKVAYFDFEMSDKQFENRYSENYENHYTFSDNFIRVCIDFLDMPDDIEKEGYILTGLESFIITTGAKVIIIDNMTWLASDLEKSKNATKLAKGLKRLMRKYNLSFLILAHTPKRDPNTPITRNHCKGSGSVMDFADSSFSIGTSCQGPERRYIKQIKVRNTSFNFGAENVCVCDVEKPSNFLGFKFAGNTMEVTHLKALSEKEQNDIKQQIIELKGSNPKLTHRGIAKELGISESKAYRILAKHKKEYGDKVPF